MDGPCVQSFPHVVVRHTRTAQACLQEYLLEGPRKSPGRAVICQLPPAQAPLRAPQRRHHHTPRSKSLSLELLEALPDALLDFQCLTTWLAAKALCAPGGLPTEPQACEARSPRPS